MGEQEDIRQRYARRKDAGISRLYDPASAYTRHVVAEREAVYEKILRERFSDLHRVRMLEVGAGTGGNLPFFMRLGIPVENIFANELLEDRLVDLKRVIPPAQVTGGDARALAYVGEFDLVFQSTVFTSVLDDRFKRELAERLWTCTRPGGMILWYDFTYDNPRNPDVKGVPVREIRSLFPGAPVVTHRVTVAPPIGRRIGRLYHTVNTLFPFLRTHVVAGIYKD